MCLMAQMKAYTMPMKNCTHVPQITRNMAHKYRQKLDHLLEKNGITRQENEVIHKMKKSGSKNRRFIPRSKYKKLKKKLASKPINLVVNYSSDFNITNGMKKLLNRGLGFVPCPRAPNKTELITDFVRHERAVR